MIATESLVHFLRTYATEGANQACSFRQCQRPLSTRIGWQVSINVEIQGYAFQHGNQRRPILGTELQLPLSVFVTVLQALRTFEPVAHVYTFHLKGKRSKSKQFVAPVVPQSAKPALRSSEVRLGGTCSGTLARTLWFACWGRQFLASLVLQLVKPALRGGEVCLRGTCSGTLTRALWLACWRRWPAAIGLSHEQEAEGCKPRAHALT